MTIKQQALPIPVPPGTQTDPRSTPSDRLRDCLECGKVFTPEDLNQELCGEQCARNWWGLDYFKEVI